MSEAHSGQLAWSDLEPFAGAGTGATDAACPVCGPDCRTPSNRNRKVLRIWFSADFITYKCARCSIAGWAKSDASASRPRVERPAPKQEPDRQDRIELARYLWQRSLPFEGSLAATYLQSRGCLVPSTALRLLPGRGDHPPAMVARFGLSRDVTGIHLTKISSDGNGKAGTDKDKIMIGPSMGQPIVVHDNPDRPELVVCEGIEDAASLALITGWSAWAAGAAGRIAAVVAAASHFEKVFVSVDRDRAGRHALAAARQARPSIIPLRVWKALPCKIATDPNKALQLYGPDALTAVVEWCEQQAMFARGAINFEELQRETIRATGIFLGIAEKVAA